MNGKQAKLIRKYAGIMKYDADYIKREFKKLDWKTKGKFTSKTRHALRTVNAARA